MQRNQGLHIIHSFRKKWLISTIFSTSLFALAIAGLLAVVLYKFFGWPFVLAIPLFIAACVVMLAIKKPWQITALDVVKFLNSKYPALQESCGLLLRDASTLNLLESLQVAKTEHALMHITMPISFAQQLRAALFTVLFAVVLSVALYAIPLHFGNIKPSTGKPYSPNKPPEKILPGISSTQLEAVPPAYTKLAPYTQQQMNIQVPEGSAVKMAFANQYSGPNIETCV